MNVPELGSPSSYLTLEAGGDVYASDGEKVGVIEYVLADADLDIFDGIVIDTSVLPGGQRFADAADVDGIYERGVVLGMSRVDAERLPEPSENPGVMEVNGVEDVDRSETSEKLRRAWELVSGKGLSDR